jgi:hypothetical protein
MLRRGRGRSDMPMTSQEMIALGGHAVAYRSTQ